MSDRPDKILNQKRHVWVIHAYHELTGEYGFIEELGLFVGMIHYKSSSKRFDYGLDYHSLIVSTGPHGPWKYWHYADDMTKAINPFPNWNDDFKAWQDAIYTSEKEWRDKILSESFAKVATRFTSQKENP